MIDFKNAEYLKLHAVRDDSFLSIIQGFMIQGEQIIGTFKSVRDGVVFTTHRIIVINVKGLTGKKQDYTTLPYSKIQVFSAETAGVLDLDSELELWFSGLGRVKLEFTAGTDIKLIAKMISERIL